MELNHHDRHHIEAAQGWLELGLPHDALGELENVSPAKRKHPAFLTVQWSICSEMQHWETCVEIAATLVTLEPGNVVAWINRSYALHELKRTHEAHDLLLPAFEKFPEDATVPYNLACYCAQLGRLERAVNWLDVALTKAGTDAPTVKLRALDDPDLEPIWPDIAAS
jgi:predicted Zn-dependent protease